MGGIDHPEMVGLWHWVSHIDVCFFFLFFRCFFVVIEAINMVLSWGWNQHMWRSGWRNMVGIQSPKMRFLCGISWEEKPPTKKTLLSQSGPQLNIIYSFHLMNVPVIFHMFARRFHFRISLHISAYFVPHISPTFLHIYRIPVHIS